MTQNKTDAVCFTDLITSDVKRLSGQLRRKLVYQMLFWIEAGAVRLDQKRWVIVAN